MLASLRNMVTEFADSHDLAIVPGIPHHDLGREISIDPADLNLPGFLQLASTIGDGVLYLQAKPFDPDTDAGLVTDEMVHLTSHKGQTGEVCVAFARQGHGMLHFWELRTAWYDEWQELLEPRQLARFLPDEFSQSDRLSLEERDRQAAEVAVSILGNPEFRAASPQNRRRIAELAVPEGTDSSVGWAAAREALSQAEQMTRDIYVKIRPRLEELAAELISTPDYQQSSSATAQKEAAALFLAARCDGFYPPPLHRDELYAKAKRLAKQGGKGLF